MFIRFKIKKNNDGKFIFDMKNDIVKFLDEQMPEDPDWDEKMEKEKEYREAVRLCKEKLGEIQFFLDSLDSYKERTVMEFRYLYFLEWMDIAIRLNYSIQNVNKIHSDALLHLLKKHEEIIEKSGRRLF